MNQNKAAPTVAVAGAEAGSATREESTTRTKSIPHLSANGNKILQQLAHGRKNAITRRMLMAETKMPDRAMRLEIEAMRRAGIVILADVSGYYLPGNVEEVQEYIRQEEARARSTFQSIQSARQLETTMLQQVEQLTFGGVGWCG
jgi:biotin operon repressor